MQRVRECLIIDDDKDDQEIFMMCLNKVSKDIKCRAINDGVDAIAMLKTEEQYVPDYIFLDVNMPKLNGIDCLKFIKNIDRLQNTKVFMYSTSSEQGTVEKSKSMGAEDFIVKPAKTADLKARLNAIFNIISGIES